MNNQVPWHPSIEECDRGILPLRSMTMASFHWGVWAGAAPMCAYTLPIAIPSTVKLLSLCSPSCCTLRLECFCPILSYQFIQPHTLWLTLELLLTLLTQKVRWLGARCQSAAFSITFRVPLLWPLWCWRAIIGLSVSSPLVTLISLSLGLTKVLSA